MKPAEFYQDVTNRLIEMMEQPGQCEELFTSLAQMPNNAKTGNLYSGINVLILTYFKHYFAYESNQWLTYKQAQEMGGQVRKGEKSVRCAYYNTRIKTSFENGKEVEEVIPVINFFNVFNIEQIDGLDLPEPKAQLVRHEVADIPEIDKLMANWLCPIRYCDSFTPAYSRLEDEITLPTKNLFIDSEAFYSVALHEMGHSTGHETRLKREYGTRFGSNAYAFEELVAELSSCFSCAYFGLVDKTLSRHADYLNSWIAVMKKDAKAIFTAAAAAQKACDMILEHMAKFDTQQVA